MAAKKLSDKNSENGFLTKPSVGTTLTIFSGLSFLFLCMILPLVGKAGVETVHSRENFLVFLSVLILTLVVSGLAIKSKIDRSKIDDSPFPVFSTIIGGLSLVLFFALILGLLKI